MPLVPLEWYQRHSVFRLSVTSCSCASMCDPTLKFCSQGYLINRSWKFHQIDNFGAVGHKDEPIKC